MPGGYYHKPWYVWLVRVAALACVSVVLWVSAIASPFVVNYILDIKGTPDRLLTAATLAVSVLIVIGFLCYLIDRV